ADAQVDDAIAGLKYVGQAAAVEVSTRPARVGNIGASEYRHAVVDRAVVVDARCHGVLGYVQNRLADIDDAGALQAHRGDIRVSRAGIERQRQRGSHQCTHFEFAAVNLGIPDIRGEIEAA